jgi:hypothetical protein
LYVGCVGNGGQAMVRPIVAACQIILTPTVTERDHSRQKKKEDLLMQVQCRNIHLAIHLQHHELIVSDYVEP